jgi:XTP/dITP diphosphohydrolase
MRLLLASQNPGKLHEMGILVAGLPFEIVGPKDLDIHDAPDETGVTFQENARIKALHYARAAGCLAVGDDSGLSVDALDGKPGLYSARFGGNGLDDVGRNRLLLSMLAGVPPERRGARFTCAVAVAGGRDVLFEVQESVDGFVAAETRGQEGFGYDPLFFYPPFGKTFGEVDRREKDRVSHRGKAFARLRAYLRTISPA